MRMNRLPWLPLLTVVLIAVLAVVACAPAPAPPQAPSGAEQPAAQKMASEPAVPEKPQILHIAAEAEPRVLDPTAPAEGMGEYILRATVGEPLLEYSYDENMEIRPLLATEWEWVDDTTLKFTLREGVKFHNGEELTLADVKYTYERVADEEVGSRWRSYVEPIEGIEVVDDYHGVIHLKKPYAPLTTYVLEYIMIVPEGSGDELKTNPVGTGPFKFKEWVKGEKAIFVKNENYWDAGKPELDEVVWQFQPEYQTRLASLRAGDSDIVYVVQPSDVAALEQEPGVEISPNLLLGTFYVGFNVQEPPFDDVNMRQAVRYAVDKELVLETGQAGKGATKDIQESLNSPFYTDKFDYGRDLDKAREFLEKAGYNGEELELVVPNTPREGPFGDAVAFSLDEAGINVKTTKLPVPEFIDRVFVKRNYPFTVLGYGNVPDPDFFHYAYFHSDGSNNIFLYSNPTVDELLEKGRSTTDVEERKKIYEELFRILYTEDVPVVSLVQSYRPMALRSYVKDFEWNPLIRANLRNVTIQE